MRPEAARLSRGARKMGIAAGIGVDGPVALTLDYFEHIRASFCNLASDSESEAIGRYAWVM